MAGLEVQIGADASELDKEIQSVERKLKKLESQKAIQISLGADTSKLDKSIASSQARLDGLKKAMDNTGKSVQSFAPKVASGSNALTQFSRIAQDAPFGIMGIGNNITATAESFGNLVKESGSAGGALKAVASSMLGTGGILLAVSLVTTGLTYMAQNGITVSDVFSKLSGDFDELGSAMRKVGEEASKASGSEIANMKALVSVAQDETKSRQDRLIAVRELQKEFPSYFGNLSQEKILNGDLTSVTKELTSAIIARAKASAYSGKIGELALEELKLNNDLNSEVKSLTKAYSLTTKEAEKFTKEVLAGGDAFKLLEPFKKRAGFFDVAGAVASSNAIIGIREELVKNTAQQKAFTIAINETTAASIKLRETAAPKAGDKKKTFDTPQVAGIKTDIQPVTDLVDVAKLQVLTGEIDKFGNKIKGLPNVIKTGMDKAKSAFDMSGVAMLESFANFNNQLSSIVTEGTVSALSGIGEAIGSALASGGNFIESVGKTILGSMGSMLKELGKATIAYGVGLIAVKAAIKNPYLAVAAGVAMVALGSAMSSAVSKSSSSALGGGGSSGGGGRSVSTGADYSSPASGASSAGGGSTFGSGTVVFEISGTSLVGVLSNTLDKNRRIGGNLGI